MGNSDFLFAHSGFLSGMGSVVDIGGTLVEFNTTPSPEAADLRAIQADWKALRNDFLEAMRPYEEEVVGS